MNLSNKFNNLVIRYINIDARVNAIKISLNQMNNIIRKFSTKRAVGLKISKMPITKHIERNAGKLGSNIDEFRPKINVRLNIDIVSIIVKMNLHNE